MDRFNIPAKKGAIIGFNNFSLPEIWISIHDNAQRLFELERSNAAGNQRAICDSEVSYFSENLKKCFTKTWHALCSAAGWTVYGAVALSWCEGAELAQVWEGWEASGFPLKPSPEFERPARFINPALLPETAKLSELMEAAKPSQLALCAMIVALDERDLVLKFDVSTKGLKSAQPQIAAFLKSRMERKPNLTDEERDLIAHWSETVKDTEWEV